MDLLLSATVIAYPYLRFLRSEIGIRYGVDSKNVEIRTTKMDYSMVPRFHIHHCGESTKTKLCAVYVYDVKEGQLPVPITKTESSDNSPTVTLEEGVSVGEFITSERLNPYLIVVVREETPHDKKVFVYIDDCWLERAEYELSKEEE